METLMSCSSHPLLLQSSKNSAFSSSRSTNNKPQFVTIHQKLNYNNNVDISHSISLQLKPTISSVSCKSSSSESSFIPQPESNAGNTEIPSIKTPQSKTVRVKFRLIIEMCQFLFHQEFLVVGDDPILGVWDPKSAIPLKWSEGHLETAELDLPNDKKTQYKFIQNIKSREEFKWKPGPRSVFEPRETNNTTVVSEDWEIVGHQTIHEEESLAISNASEDVISNSNTDDMMPNSCTMANSNTKEPVVAHPISSVENMNHPEEEQTDAGDEVTSTGSLAIERKSASLGDEDTLFESVKEPVRVPRSVALAITTAKEGVPPEVKRSNNVKTESNVNDVEVATEDDRKCENQKKEEPGKSTTQQEATRRMSDDHNKPDEEQVGVGDEKGCQSTNEESTEVLDVPSEEDAE